MKTLVLDIETRPNLAHTWSLWNVNVGLPQLIESGHVLCWAAKWVGTDTVMFGKHTQQGSVTRIWKLLDHADVVVGFNHVKFDLPWLSTEFVKQGMPAPSPAFQIDLCQVAKTRFKFPSNKLQYLAGELLEGSKVSTGGHQLWIDVMANKPEAWAKMRAYNEHDVRLTEALYERLKPWCKVPSPYLYGDVHNPDTCAQCGSGNIKANGHAYTQLGRYQRWVCNDCGRYMRGARRTKGVDTR